MKETINILCTTDDNYAPYCGVMLTSLFETNADNTINVFILIERPLHKKNSVRLVKLGEKYGNIVQFILVDDSFLRKFDLIGPDQRLLLSTFYKLYATELLPESMSRVLYLDDDIIITGDLSQLWKIDMADKAIAAVDDVLLFTYPDVRQGCLAYPDEAGYFNGGVVLINLEYWRAHNIGPLCMNFIEQHHDILQFCEQDVMNSLLWNKRVNLSPTFNFQYSFLMNTVFNVLPHELQEEIRETVRSTPIIIHFVGPMKPWQLHSSYMPYRKTWLFYKSKSPWAHLLPSIPSRRPLNWLLKRFVLWPFGFLRPDKEFIDINDISKN